MEAEYGALLYNVKSLEALRTTLKEIGHTQPAAEIITYNSTEYVIMKGTNKQKCTKAMDIHFCRVRDRVEQKHFYVKWNPGYMNLRDYFTKHHPPTLHRSMQQTYLLNTIIELQERILQGCAKTRNLGDGEHGA